MSRSSIVRGFLSVAVVACVGCGRKAVDEIEYGTVKDSVYHNKYFGLTVDLPTDWSIQDQKTREAMMDLGGEMPAGETGITVAVSNSLGFGGHNACVAFRKV